MQSGLLLQMLHVHGITDTVADALRHSMKKGYRSTLYFYA